MYKPEWFSTPYDKGIEVLLESGATKEDVAKVLSSAYISDAHDAVCHWNGIGEMENFDWCKGLREAFTNRNRGKALKKISEKLLSNEDVDLLALHSELGSAIAQESFGLKAASEIDYKHYKPFMETGYDPIDKTLGGIPTDGPVIVYGLTGVGKSKFVTAVVNSILHKYPDKRAAIYTLEMNEVHWMSRTVKLFPSIQQVLPRLYVSGQVRDMEELVAEVSAGKYDLVVLDDMDNMVKASSADEYEKVYRRVKEVCRFLAIPFFVIGQPNREAKWAVSDKKNGRFLGRYDVAWSGAAENSAALQIALQTANGIDLPDETFPTTDEDMDYIIFWKSRDGWMGDYDPSKAIGPGAVVMEHSSNWQGKPYGGKWKLWSVQSGNHKATHKKKKEE